MVGQFSLHLPSSSTIADTHYIQHSIAALHSVNNMLSAQKSAAARFSSKSAPKPTRGLVSARAANGFSADGFAGGNVNDSQLHKLLAQRLQELQAAELAQQQLARRPPLPSGTSLMWDEMQADHNLLDKWHRNCWTQLQQQAQFGGGVAQSSSDEE